ncbi:hypothetical protein Cgig2_024505 [Carnegiea gigantea]|uniref:Uncharacterized protein n=1 Tax=Carnegiea gigantea TaxID=171969 RepID=A0A9Q1KM26_9CARY|nr:hypothetical protein Cgig2_024505 [Carnegiea gigantea]
MRIRKRILTKEDFGDDPISKYCCSSLSSLDVLVIVAQKALEKETALSSISFLRVKVVEREQHKVRNMIKMKLFECQATQVEENTMVEQQFTSSGNPKMETSELPQIEKTAPKPNIPITMVEVEENAGKGMDGDDIQIWSFRIDGKLTFALVKLPGSSKNSSFERSNSKTTEVEGITSTLRFMLQSGDS